MHTQPDLMASTIPGPAFSASPAEHPTLARFRGLMEKCFGVRITEGSPGAREEFARLPEAARGAFLGALRENCDDLEECLRAHNGRPSELALFRKALGKLGLLGEAHVLEQVEEDDVVEIFDTSLRQVYRSYNCFEVCNYSFEELALYPFYELYGRHSAISAQLMEACQAVASGRVPFWSFAELPEYHIQELRRDPPEFFAMRERFGARLRSTLDGETYLLSVKKVRALGGRTGGASVRYL